MNFDQERIDAYTETVIKSRARDLRIPPKACLVEGEVAPCAIVIFGATGDLTSRKLAPSLYNLYLTGGMPKNFAILGAARSAMSHDQFRERIKNSLAGVDLSRWEAFGKALYYQQIHFDSRDSFSELAATLSKLDKDHNLQGNTIFYLAIPPSLYKPTAVMLGDLGLSVEGQNGSGWRRLIVEKPFGRDLQSAEDLDRTISQHFAEHQVYRIDHYLAKETIQNVLVLRFANAIFEPIWNRQFIDRVHITAAEALGVENRASYYEEAGVIRDMLQNHLMQLLALTAMEPPARFEANHVRDETCKVFRSLKPFDKKDIDQSLVLGQYVPGFIDGQQVPGYRQEPGVSPKSLTPTFGAMKVFIENWRWEDVPFYITSGKRLHEKRTEIVIHFKRVPHSLFRGVLGESITPNVMTLGVYPEETINLTFQTKNPGALFCLRSVRMEFNYADNYTGPEMDAYEIALLDCMQGDQTLFWRQDAVELCWAFIDPILEECEDCEDRREQLRFYEAGSWGPREALKWRR